MNEQQKAVWVPTNERKPTKEDGDQDGYVLCNNGMGNYWTHWFNVHIATHWLSIPPVPAPPDPFEAWWENYCVCPDDGYAGDQKKVHMRSAFHAGLAKGKEGA